jgi:CheY-like chemotaxis protein
VLLSEDNQINQEVARELLADAGCVVEVVCNGREAVRAVDEHLRKPRYDVVLMDCQMPKMDGFEATRRIRGLERAAARPGDEPAARLPIIALTANAAEGDRQRCLAAGMDGYVTKPVEPDVLVERVRAALAARAASMRAVRSEPSAPSSAGAPAEMPDESANDAVQPAIDARSLLRRCGGKPHLVERLFCRSARFVRCSLRSSLGLCW